MYRALPVGLVTVAALVLGGCAAAEDSSPPSWEPSPQLSLGAGPGGQASPIVPVPSPQRTGRRGPGGGGPPTGSGTASAPNSRRRIDPNVVATHLSAPIGLAMLPDGTALVGERTTGRIVRVQPEPGRPVPTVKVLHGLDTSGDGGLLDLALSPSYVEDGLVYAYVTTRTDNRVVDFTLTGPVTPVLTGIPKGPFGNTGRILFGPDDRLYIGTGDGNRPARASTRTNLAGKVLRVDGIGDAPRSNPYRASPVWTTGHRVVNGLCFVPRSRWLIEVETGPVAGGDEVNVIVEGADYGWPASSTARRPAALLPSAYAAPGGCAVLNGRVWVTSLDGSALLSAPLKLTSTFVGVGSFRPALKHRYGRLKTVVAAADGALWLTTSNRDGHGKPVPADERVIRYVPTVRTGDEPV